MERYAVAWLCRARLRPGAAAWVGVTLPVCDAATQSKVLFAYSSAFPHILSFPNMNKKNQKYENSAIALDQTLITASVLCFLLILFLVVCKLAMETPAKRFLKKKNN